MSLNIFSWGNNGEEGDEQNNKEDAFNMNDDLGLSDDEEIEPKDANKLSSSIVGSEQRIREMQQEIQDRDNMIQLKSNEIRRLSLVNHDYETELKQLRDKVDELNKEDKEKLVSENHHMKADIMLLQKDKKTAYEKNKKQAEELEKARNLMIKANAMRREYEKLQMDMKEMQQIQQIQENGSVEELKKQNALLVEEKEKENAEMKRMVSEMSERIEMFTLSLDKERKEKEALEVELNALKEARRDDDNQIIANARESNAKEIEELKEAKTKEIEELRANYDAIVGEKEKEIEEMKRTSESSSAAQVLEEEKKKLSEENLKIRETVDYLNKENTELNDILKERTQETERLMKSVEEEKNKENELSEKLEQCMEKIRGIDASILQEKTKSIAEYNTVLNKKEEENERLTIALTNINRELESVHSENDDLAAQIASLQKAEKEWEERGVKAEALVDSLSSDVEKRKRIEVELRELIDKSNKSYDALKESMNEREKELKELKTELDQKNNEMEAVNKAGGDHAEEVTRLRDLLKKEEEELQQKERVIEEQKTAISEIESIKKAMEDQNRMMESMRTEDEARKRKFNVIKNKHENEMKGAKEEIEKLQKMIDENRGTIEKEKEIETLNQQMEVLNQTMSQQKEKLLVVPSLEHEIETREGEIGSLRSSLSVLTSQFGDLKQKFDKLTETNDSMKRDFEAKVLAVREDEKKSVSAEVSTLKDANDNLRVLLNSAEKKYIHLSNVNSDLQKRIDIMEQKARLTGSPDVEMNTIKRTTNKTSISDTDDSEEEEQSLLGRKEMPLDMKARHAYNKLRRTFSRLPADLQKLVIGYIIVVHILLFILLIK